MAQQESRREDAELMMAAELMSLLRQVTERARDYVGAVDDPKAQALLETTAEVAIGLHAAFDHYEHRAEPAWR